ncbi:heat-inducible transcriptional repressor HrcA [Acetobacterium tundrae]|uniref:Heat-inducible transcription repressor HrcA n=1 Tax=Acetobacterium tundrae TaxID=132932 RepID=A0ABR6WMP5_9FIRM|nr:heat-inducible transcriptional repressor HrcA [Acetobacterium tundrae]MBC3797397.1 heat-inducible transcription repressor HrcA [Acetobacterium tundrae]
MELNERKKKILEVIIRDYINTAEPVGSRTLSKRCNLGISPATIRNEMADLEDLGYLVQPHTSSGRIPTQKAYRYYVDEIMEIRKLEKMIRTDIHRGFLNTTTELGSTMDHTARVLSQLTNYTAVVLAPRVTNFNCRNVQIVSLIKNRVLMVVVTNEGMAKNIEVSLSQDVDNALVLKLSNVINGFLKNTNLSDLSSELVDRIQEMTPEESKLIHEIIPHLKKVLLDEDSEVHSTGLTNLFNYPEFSDVNKIKQLINLVQEKQVLSEMMTNNNGNQVIRIKIGSENDNENLKDFSIITSTYELDGEMMGAFGVIGPTRMNYDNVSSVLNYIRNELNLHISNLLMK